MRAFLRDHPERAESGYRLSPYHSVTTKVGSTNFGTTSSGSIWFGMIFVDRAAELRYLVLAVEQDPEIRQRTLSILVRRDDYEPDFLESLTKVADEVAGPTKIDPVGLTSPAISRRPEARLSFDRREYGALAQFIHGQTGPGFGLQASGRAAISRAHYAAFCYARDSAEVHLGFQSSVGPGVHQQLPVFLEANGPLGVGKRLTQLRKLRNRADYSSTSVLHPRTVVNALVLSQQAIALMP